MSRQRSRRQGVPPPSPPTAPDSAKQVRIKLVGSSGGVRAFPSTARPSPSHVLLDLGSLRTDGHRARLAALRATREAQSVHLTGGTDWLRGRWVEMLDAAGRSVTWDPLTDPAATHDDDAADDDGHPTTRRA